MFKKILIAEDYEFANQGIVNLLKEKMGIADVYNTQYCYDAYLKFRKAHQDNQPFELLITDLSFKKDHRERNPTSGIELIEEIKKIQPDIKTIVYSQEDKPDKVSMIFDKQHINGYVCKGQNAIKQLTSALEQVYLGNTYIPQELEGKLYKDNTINLDDFDILILKELANGLTKKEISEKLKRQKKTPSSESTIDKRVGKLFDDFKAKNTTHLIAMVKDLGFL